MQQSLLANVDGITVETLTVLPLGDSNASAGKLPFTFTVRSKDASSLKDLLHRLERSIRTIDIDSLSLQKNDNDYTMSVEAHAYYQEAKQVTLTNKVVPVR